MLAPTAFTQAFLATGDGYENRVYRACNMGAPMAANLANAGYEVVGFDVTDVTVEGVTSCSDAPLVYRAVILSSPCCQTDLFYRRLQMKFSKA